MEHSMRHKKWGGAKAPPHFSMALTLNQGFKPWDQLKSELVDHAHRESVLLASKSANRIEVAAIERHVTVCVDDIGLGTLAEVVVQADSPGAGGIIRTRQSIVLVYGNILIPIGVHPHGLQDVVAEGPGAVDGVDLVVVGLAIGLGETTQGAVDIRVDTADVEGAEIEAGTDTPVGCIRTTKQVVQALIGAGQEQATVAVHGCQRVGAGKITLLFNDFTRVCVGDDGADQGQAGKRGRDVGDGIAGTDIDETTGAKAATLQVVVSDGIDKDIQFAGGHLHGSVVATVEEGTPAAGQADVGITGCETTTTFGDVDTAFNFPDSLQAVAQVLGTLEADTGSTAGDVPQAVVAAAEIAVGLVGAQVVDGGVDLAVDGDFGIGCLGSHGQRCGDCQGKKLLLHLNTPLNQFRLKTCLSRSNDSGLFTIKQQLFVKKSQREAMVVKMIQFFG